MPTSKPHTTTHRPKTTSSKKSKTTPKLVLVDSKAPSRRRSVRRPKDVPKPLKLPSVWSLTKRTSRLLWRYRRLFLGITLVYGLLSIILVRGLGTNTDVSSLKATLQQSFGGSSAAVLTSGVAVFGVLLNSAGSTTNAEAGPYQLFLGLIVSLAIIWSLREVLSGVKVRVRDGYYSGMYPLIPFVMVLLVIGIQLIPFAVGLSLYSAVTANGIAVAAIEKTLWAALLAALTLASLYLISSSLMALYVVTLPDMTPRKALRTARQLVRYRRWPVLRKIFALPVILLVVAGLIMLPVILIAAPAAQWVFFLLTMFSLVALHGYLFMLYKELLREQS